MADDSQSRRLATIVSLDVAGYSARIEADEVPYDFKAECEKTRKVPPIEYRF